MEPRYVDNEEIFIFSNNNLMGEKSTLNEEGATIAECLKLLFIPVTHSLGLKIMRGQVLQYVELDWKILLVLSKYNNHSSIFNVKENVSIAQNYQFTLCLSCAK